MDIVQKINTSAATIAQLAVLSGVPADRMYKWRDKRAAPNGEDIAALEAVFQKITNLSKDEIKVLVHTAKEGEDLSVKASKSKEVIPLGKHRPLRLKPEDYAAAFGDWKGLPMYNVPITASFIATYRDETVYRPQYYLHDPRFKDCDFGVIITGDSMYSEIRHGDFVVCKEIVDRSFIVFGDIYYITAKNGLETCKYVNADPNSKDNLLLVPRNENISPSPISKSMIDKLYKVKGIVRGY